MRFDITLVTLALLCACSPGLDGNPESTPDQDEPRGTDPTTTPDDDTGDTPPPDCEDPADCDGDGYAPASKGGADCDDHDATVHPGAEDSWYDGIDSDCDGADDFDQDGDGYQSAAHGGDDCDDTDVNINPSRVETWYDGVDSDCDGADDFDQDGDGHQSAAFGGTDCNDTNASIHPDMVETWYDGIDGNCDGADDFDQDADGYQHAAHGGEDCDDLLATVNPAAAETCSTTWDDDCDGTVADPDADGCTLFYLDADGDGVGADTTQCMCVADGNFTASSAGDCDDSKAGVHPGATETCSTNWDDDCDGDDNDPGASGCSLFYGDGDGDGFGNASSACMCAAETPYTASNDDDCNDSKASINPDATETCATAWDDDCDGDDNDPWATLCQTFYADDDADGYGDPADSTCICVADAPYDETDDDDCNDGYSDTHPGADEIFWDGRDNDCDGAQGPVLSFTSPAVDTPTEGTMTISGKCDATAGNVTLTGDVTTVSTNCTGGGTYSKQVTFVPTDGPVTVEIEQTDAAGNTASKTRDFRVSKCSDGFAGSYPADWDYTENDAGDWCVVYNKSGGGWNFSDDGARSLLADPTAIALDGKYYVSGTSDSASTANYEIWVSDNLVDWSFHMYAFDDSGRSGAIIELNDGREFCRMWAPELYLDPTDSSTVYLSFTGVEDRWANDFCSESYPELYNTVMLSTVSTTRFKSGGSFSSPSDGRSHEPMWYHYREDNTGSTVLYDGGYTQGHTIPVTGSPTHEGADPGDAYLNGNRYCHRSMGCNTWMALDSFVYHDPATGERWMLYTWIDANNADWKGNHVAAYPMLTHSQMDALADPDDHMPLAFRKNDNHPVGGGDNGCWGRDGAMNGYCVAEGPAVFDHDGYTYVLYSRNGWNSPAYGTFYRYTDSGFRDLDTGTWNNETIDEHTLVISENRDDPDGIAFGHGTVFDGPGGHPYFVFHYNDGTGARSPFFKELRFNGDGTMEEISNKAGVDPENDAFMFLVPRP